MTEAGSPSAQQQTVADSPDRAAGLNTSGLLYGTIVSAAALAAGAGRGDSSGDIVGAMASTLVIYWLAHVYTETVSRYGTGKGADLRHRLGDAARHEAAILLGGLPALAVAVIEYLTGVRPWLIVLSAVGTAIVVLAVEGFLAGTRAGVTGRRLGVETAGAAVFGVMIAGLLVFLHGH